MTKTRAFALTLVGSAVLALGVIPLPAAAQQMGTGGYSFPARSPSLAAQFQFQRSAASGAQSSAGGLGALTQFSTVYNSSSTAIANMNSVTQNLSDGSTGTLQTLGDQDSAGDQDAAATTDVEVDNSVNDSGNLTEILAETVPAQTE